MKRLHLFGLVLVAIFAASATASAVANAELAILPTPSEASPVTFAFKSKAGEKTTLEGVAGGTKKIVCSSVSGTGSATSVRLGKIEFEFVGCEGLLTVKCTGLSDTTPGHITFKAEWHIRHLLNEKGEPEGVAFVVLPGHVHFTCAGILFLVLGCVASMDVLTKENGESIVEKLVKSAFVNFLQEKGKQKPLEIDNDASNGMESCMLTTQEEAKTPEESGQGGSGTIETFAQGGAEVTLLVHLK